MGYDVTCLIILTAIATLMLLGGLALMVAAFRSSLARDCPINEAAQEVDEVKDSVTCDDEKEIQVRVSIEILADSQRKTEYEEAGGKRHEGEPPTFQPCHEFPTNQSENSTQENNYGGRC